MYVPIVKSMGYLPMILIEKVTGRIIVDAFGFGKFNPDQEILVKAIKPAESNEPHSTSKDKSSSDDDSERGRPSPKEQQLNKNEIQAIRQHLLLMSPMLAGYSLTLKKWREFTNSRPENSLKSGPKSGYLLTTSGHCRGMKTPTTILSFQQTKNLSFYHLSRIISSRAKRLMM